MFIALVFIFCLVVPNLLVTRALCRLLEIHRVEIDTLTTKLAGVEAHLLLRR